MNTQTDKPSDTGEMKSRDIWALRITMLICLESLTWLGYINTPAIIWLIVVGALLTVVYPMVNKLRFWRFLIYAEGVVMTCYALNPEGDTFSQVLALVFSFGSLLTSVVILLLKKKPWKKNWRQR